MTEWEGRSAADWTRRLAAATVEFHERIGSTSDRAREALDAGARVPLVVVADRQSAGRGRRGRRWLSDTPRGLWVTMARAWVGEGRDRSGDGIRGAAGAATPGGRSAGDAASVLPLRAGLAVARVVEAIAPGVRAQVKWPNDVLVQGRKVGGILCERVRGAVLVGIGINVNHKVDELPRGVSPPATSLRAAAGVPVARGLVLERLSDALRLVRTRPDGEIPADELAAINARSALAGRRLAVSGAVRVVVRGRVRGDRGTPDSAVGSLTGASARWRAAAAVDPAGPALRTVESLAALGGSVLADGSLELLPVRSAPESCAPRGPGPGSKPSGRSFRGSAGQGVAPGARLVLLAGSVQLSPGSASRPTTGRQRGIS